MGTSTLSSGYDVSVLTKAESDYYYDMDCNVKYQTLRVEAERAIAAGAWSESDDNKIPICLFKITERQNKEVNVHYLISDVHPQFMQGRTYEIVRIVGYFSPHAQGFVPTK